MSFFYHKVANGIRVSGRVRVRFRFRFRVRVRDITLHRHQQDGTYTVGLPRPILWRVRVRVRVRGTRRDKARQDNHKTRPDQTSQDKTRQDNHKTNTRQDIEKTRTAKRQDLLKGNHRDIMEGVPVRMHEKEQRLRLRQRLRER